MLSVVDNKIHSEQQAECLEFIVKDTTKIIFSSSTFKYKIL